MEMSLLFGALEIVILKIKNIVKPVTELLKIFKYYITHLGRYKYEKM